MAGECPQCGEGLPDDICRHCLKETGEPWPLAGHRPAPGFEAVSAANHGLAFGVLPSWREIPGPLEPTAAKILAMHGQALEHAIGGFGAPARLGLGYAEREACFRYHGIDDPDAQEFLVEAFAVIESGRAEGSAAGREAREAKEGGS